MLDMAEVVARENQRAECREADSRRSPANQKTGDGGENVRSNSAPPALKQPLANLRRRPECDGSSAQERC